MYVRATEHPQWTLMLTDRGDIVCLRQEYETSKKTCGWVMVARESELLPFNQPHWRDQDRRVP